MFLHEHFYVKKNCSMVTKFWRNLEKYREKYCLRKSEQLNSLFRSFSSKGQTQHHLIVHKLAWVLLSTITFSAYVDTCVTTPWFVSFETRVYLFHLLFPNKNESEKTICSVICLFQLYTILHTQYLPSTNTYCTLHLLVM